MASTERQRREVEVTCGSCSTRSSPRSRRPRSRAWCRSSSASPSRCSSSRSASSLGNVFDLSSQEWLDFIASFASIVLTFLAGMEVDPGVHAPPARGVRRDRRRLVRRPLRRRLARRATSCSTGRSKASLIAGHRALDDVARGRLRRARRARPDRRRHRQAADERDLRHRPLHGARALGDLHQAERLVPGLPRRLGRADPRPAADRAAGSSGATATA